MAGHIGVCQYSSCRAAVGGVVGIVGRAFTALPQAPAPSSLGSGATVTGRCRHPSGGSAHWWVVPASSGRSLAALADVGRSLLMRGGHQPYSSLLFISFERLQTTCITAILHVPGVLFQTQLSAAHSSRRVSLPGRCSPATAQRCRGRRWRRRTCASPRVSPGGVSPLHRGRGCIPECMNYKQGYEIGTAGRRGRQVQFDTATRSVSICRGASRCATARA